MEIKKDFKTIEVKGALFYYDLEERYVIEMDNIQMFISKIGSLFSSPEKTGEYLVDVLENYLQGKKFVNLTPHDIVLKLEHVYFSFLPEPEPARVKTNASPVNDKRFPSLIPVVEQSYDVIEGLPDPQEDVIYITSLVVRQAAQEQGRTDVVSPDTSPAGAIRDEKGMIEAVRRFVR